MANVKVFADKQTGQTQHAPDLSMQGHKNVLGITETSHK